MPSNIYSLGVNAPGFSGLNKQQAGSLMEPTWATTLTNCIFDDNGRIASRKGYKNINTLGIVDDVDTLIYDNISLDISSEQTTASAIKFSTDETKMYIVGAGGADLDQYDLSIAGDITTASSSGDTYNFSEDSDVKDIIFKSDGTKMYAVGNTNNTIYQYSLSIAWDITTTSYDSVSFSITSEDTAPTGIEINSFGTAIYISGSSTDTVYQYTLSTIWDLSTASYSSKNIVTGTEDSQPWGITFKKDGTVFYINGQIVVDKIYQYNLSTAWDISTASYSGFSFDTTNEDNVGRGLYINNNNTKIFMPGATNDKVFQYNLTKFNIKSIHEYIDGAGNSIIILAAGNAIYKVVGTSLTDISGTITTPTADNWKFINFNKVCVGMQDGHAPIVITTTGGSFADITLSGTQQPSTSTSDMLAAFGRVWAIDGTDLKYSDALDHTAWNSVFDLTTTWLNGMDEGVAITEFNGHLVVFGKRTVIVYNNPWNPTGGGTLSLAQMSLVENIEGIGCVARDSIQHIGNDIIYLSNNGLVSFSRIIQEKSMPVNDVSKNNRDYLLNLLNTETSSDIKSVYSRKEGFYLISFPSQEKLLCIDLKVRLPDNTYRFLEWDSQYYAFMNSQANDLYIGTAGYINKYEDYLDNIVSDGTGGTTYTMIYHGPWNEVHEEIKNRLKITKYISSVIVGANNQTVTLKWAC
jgi:hypothetical protein